jgi:N-acetylmuramoyl-L-alanine amidase
VSLYLTDMADVLKAAGLRVMTVPGWETRAYPKFGGYQQRPTHVMVHHTASKTTPANDLNYILNSPLSPIGNIYLDRTGVVWLVAAGVACTNGKGSSTPWNGGVPDNAMNGYSIAIEAANDGIGEPWPKMQTDAYVRLCAALCAAYDIPNRHVRAHWEWAPGRKIDPAGPSPWAIGKASWNMDRFRADVAAVNLPVTVEDDMIIENPPRRAYDSRQSQPLAANEQRVIALGAACRAAMVNVIAVAPGGNGYLVAWGAGAKPTASSVNFTTGTTIANAVVVPVVNGCITVSATVQTHVVVDVQAVWP